MTHNRRKYIYLRPREGVSLASRSARSPHPEGVPARHTPPHRPRSTDRDPPAPAGGPRPPRTTDHLLPNGHQNIGRDKFLIGRENSDPLQGTHALALAPPACTTGRCTVRRCTPHRTPEHSIALLMVSARSSTLSRLRGSSQCPAATPAPADTHCPSTHWHSYVFDQMYNAACRGGLLCRRRWAALARLCASPRRHSRQAARAGAGAPPGAPDLWGPAAKSGTVEWSSPTR